VSIVTKGDCRPFGEAPGRTLRGNPTPPAFFATGLSTVLHPRNPWVPAFHANFR
jgi:coproporphyrinogen III oxidase